MIKKTVNYIDFNGNEQTEDLYFHFSEEELVTIEYGEDGRRLSDVLKEIVEAENAHLIIKYFKQIVLDAYGVRSEDGRRFIKNEKLREEFSQTVAYSDLFMELATDDGAAAKFVNGIIPQNTSIRDKIQK